MFIGGIGSLAVSFAATAEGFKILKNQSFYAFFLKSDASTLKAYGLPLRN